MHLKKLDHDLHWKELVYIIFALSSVEAVENLGLTLIHFIKKITKQELMRYELIKKSLILYVEKIKEIYGENYCSPNDLLKLFSEFNVE